MISPPTLIVALTLNAGTSLWCATHLLIMLYLLVKFIKFALVSYKLLLRQDFRENLTSDAIVILILGAGT